jgi:hypothetical protein
VLADTLGEPVQAASSVEQGKPSEK